MNIGYNVSQAETLMDEIKTAYENMKIYTEEQWGTLVTTLQAEWVGEDEQDYEKEFADRICKLYDNAYNVAQGAITTIEGLVNAWYEFQAKNTLSGENASMRGFHSVSAPKIKRESKIVSAKLKTFTKETNRGLASETSKTTIENAVSKFVSEIKAQTANLFNKIEVNSAFFGNQTTNIKLYIEEAGKAVGEVTVAVKDLNDALAKLVGTNYTTAIEDISTQFDTAKTSVEQSLSELGSSRWVA